MRNHARELACIALILCLLLPNFGCKKDAASGPEPTIHIGIATKEPESPGQTPEPTPALPAGERFDALDRELFAYYVSQDRYTLRMLLKHPETYSIDPAAVPTGWGTFSAEQDRVMQTAYRDFLTRLSDIPREELTDRQQLSFDAIGQFLENQVGQGEFPYYYEPLSVLSGFHSELPLLLGLYEIEDREDVEEYLALLSDVPRYFSQILTYERERAALGLFMMEHALDTVLSQLSAVLSAGDSSFLLETFNEAISSVPGLTENERTAYCEQNKKLVTGEFAAAYAALRDGLGNLRASCRSDEGLYAKGDEGVAYFTLRMQQEGSALLLPEDALSLLEDEMYNLMVSVTDLYRAHPEVLDEPLPSLTTGDAQSDLKYLSELINAILDPLPAHEVEVREVPKELASQLSAAMYLVPPVDDAKNNTVLINAAASKDNLLFSAAHEAYPGHLYQYVYERALTDQSLFCQIMPLNGYSEGWAQMAEEWMLNTQSKFNRHQLQAKHENEMVFYVLLPAIVSIKVNAQGEDVSEISSYLSGYGDAIAQNAEVYYRYAIDEPFYYFKYALGYCQLSSMMRNAKSDLGDAFPEKSYLMQYLNLGRAQMNLLSERMDIWVDGQNAG